MTEMIRENVQDYPRPPRLEPVAQRIVIHFGGKLIADTTAAYRVLETHHAPTYYLPPQDIMAELPQAKGSSLCEWKGVAAYFDVVTQTMTAPSAAWSYAQPTPDFLPIAGYMAFYAAQMEACFVGTERVIPQPGGFYGGWVTSNLDGIPKGARGTEHW